MSRRPRVGLIGYMHEVNALAEPVSIEQGVEMTSGPGGLAAAWDSSPAIRRLRDLRDVEIVELPVWEFGASGPLLDAAFDEVVAMARTALRRSVPLDAVLVLGHGAGRTVSDLDSDATFLGMVRDEVGNAPLVVVLDFHANVSDAMCELADVLVGYRTNPHVDIVDRAMEAADHIHALLDGRRTVIAKCRPPMVLPQLAQNTLPGEPLADVMAVATSLEGGELRNISVFGGFSLADVPDCGVTVCVTADEDAALPAAAAAERLARVAWDVRSRYRLHATPLDVAVAEARRAWRGERPPVILADTADNPGGGAPANTTFILRALLDAGATGVVMGVHCDARVVNSAWEAGIGSSVRVCFNAGSDRALAVPLEVDATVMALRDGSFVPSTGVYSGSRRSAGRCCSLDLGGIRVGVSSMRLQCADDDTLRHVGLDPAAARVTVVKSRGHFRAGFAHLFADDDIIEVGAPGVASAEIGDVQWQHLPRPVFPLDEVEKWSPRVSLHRARVVA